MAKAKILVVEDEAITAKDLQNRLRGLGYDAPAIASSGEGAIKKAEEIKPDLILMDIILKGDMDGIEAAEQIRDRFDIPVVYVTAYLDEERLEKTKVSAPYGYITKPFGDKDLRPVIEMALQRHTLEKALRESEEKYRSLVTNLPDVTWTTDNEGNTTFISPNIEKVYGYTSEEIYKAGDRLWFGRIYPDDVEKVNEAYKVLFEKKEKFDVEYRIKRKDGKWIWLHDRAIATYEKEGVVYADGIFADITERKQVEEALRENRTLLNRILAATPIGIGVVEIGTGGIEDRKLGWTNQNMMKMFGFGPDEDQYIKQNASVIYASKEEYERVSQIFKENLEKGKIAEVDAKLKRKDGSVFDGYITMSFLDPSNPMKGAIATISDISGRKHAENLLRNAEEEWRNSFNSLEDIMLIIDREYNIENINEIGLKLLGKSKEEVIGQKCYHVISGVDSPCEDCPCRKSLETKKVESLDRYEERFGKYYSITSSPIFDENGEIIKFVDLMRDITEQKRIEDELKAAEEKYRIIFEAAPISLVLFDKDGLILDINTWHLTNIARGKATKADLIGKNIIAHPSIVNAGLSETYKRVLEGEPFDKKGVYFPTLIPGTSGYFDVKGVPIFKDGEVIGAVALHDDITERKQMEEKQRLFSHALDSSIDGLAMGDLEGRITYVNDAFVRMFGYSREELIGNEIAFIYSEDQLPKLEEALKATMDGGWIGELVGKRKNGELFPIAISSSLIKDDEGNVIAHMASHEDISERKRAENELKKKNKELELFNRLAVGRELKMIELKKEINALLLQLGKGSKYEIAGEEDKKNYEL